MLKAGSAGGGGEWTPLRRGQGEKTALNFPPHASQAPRQFWQPAGPRGSALPLSTGGSRGGLVPSPVNSPDVCKASVTSLEPALW